MLHVYSKRNYGCVVYFVFGREIEASAWNRLVALSDFVEDLCVNLTVRK